jgi:hypothetical protein
MKKRDYLIFIISAIAFYAAVSYALQFPENATANQFVNGDPPSYWEASKRLYTEGSLPHPLRPFFYPFLIGLSSFFGASEHQSLFIGIGINFISWLLTGLFIFKFLMENTNKKIAFVGAFIFVSNTSNIINSWAILAESVFHFLIISSIYYLFNFLKNKNKKTDLIAFISLFSLSLITRPTYFPLLFILFPLFIWAIYKRYFNFFIATISVIIFVSTVGFNAYKIHEKFGNWTLSYIGECTMYVYFSAYAKVASPEKSFQKMADDWDIEYHKRNNEIPRYTESIPWVSLKPLLFNDLRTQLENNKSGLTIAFIRDLVSNSTATNGDVMYITNYRNWGNFNSFLKTVFYWSRAQNILNSFAVLCLIPYLFWRFKSYFLINNRPVFWLLFINSFLSIFTVFISTISFSQGDRFHLVTMSLTLVSLGIFYHYKNDYKALIVKELDPSV